MDCHVNSNCPWRIVLVVGVLFWGSLAGAENIDPGNHDAQYAYAENVGWLNAEPMGAGGPGTDVDDAGVAGYVWAENVGWISLSCENTSSCATVDYRVLNDGNGRLSGYAWGENVGWINFSCETGQNTCADIQYGVTIDTVTGKFSGYAWSENIGWIKFDYAGYVENHIETAWRMNGDISSDGEVTLTDAILSLQVGTGIIPESAVHAGADINKDGRIGLEEVGYILQTLSGVRTD